MIEHIHACHRIRDEEAVPKKQKQEEESGEADDSPSCFSNCDLFHVAEDDCGVSQVDGTDAVLHNSEWSHPYLIYSFSSSTSFIIIVGDSYPDCVLSKY